jgi:hypothetical protein
MWHPAAKYEDYSEDQPEEGCPEPVPVTSILERERSKPEYYNAGQHIDRVQAQDRTDDGFV